MADRELRQGSNCTTELPAPNKDPSGSLLGVAKALELATGYVDENIPPAPPCAALLQLRNRLATSQKSDFRPGVN